VLSAYTVLGVQFDTKKNDDGGAIYGEVSQWGAEKRSRSGNWVSVSYLWKQIEIKLVLNCEI
jgi:hypothetical protein